MKPHLRYQAGRWICQVPFNHYLPAGFGLTPRDAYIDWTRWLRVAYV